MRTVLHIGMPKTGTTALQECLQASRGYLADCRVLYPANPPGCSFHNHRLLIFGFTPYRRLPRHILRYPAYTRANLTEKYDEFLGHLHGQVRDSRPGWVVLSSETLFRRLGPGARRSLRRALEPLGDLAVAAYLRRPSEYYLSNLQQRLKHSYRIGWLWVPPMSAILGSYARAFGPGAVRPRIYDRSLLAEGDIVRDFLRTSLPEVAIDIGRLTPEKRGNETVSAESMDLLSRYRAAFHAEADNVATRDSIELVRTLRRADAAVGARRPQLLPEIAENIDYARADPLRLRDAYGIEFPGLDYRRLERRAPWIRLPGLPGLPRRLSELVLIDRPLQRELLHRLAGSRWTKADPARRPWIDGLLREPPAGR
jgi:hypothetical protein